MHSIRSLLRRPQARISLGIAAVAVVAVLVVYGVYVYGGSSGPSTHAAIPAATLTPTTNETVYTLDSSSSQASFTINEVLFGKPNVVVGKTTAVAGEVLVNTTNPSQSRLSQIQVDLSTLVTDSDMRNRALQGRIFETGTPANQYATFSATSLEGMPSTVAVGQTVSFKVLGTLTIHQVSRPATFVVTMSSPVAGTLRGQAQTTVRYQDFNLAIPNVPSVTNVSDNVTLALTFSARAAKS